MVVVYGNLWMRMMMIVDGGVQFNLVGIVLVAMVQIRTVDRVVDRGQATGCRMLVRVLVLMLLGGLVGGGG